METESRKYRCRIKARYIMAILTSTGLGIAYGLKVALHIVIIGMVNNTALDTTTKMKSNSDCHFTTTISNSTHEDGPFLWSSSVQGLALSSYFWGYLVGQIPAGRMSELFSAKWVMFTAITINVICFMLIPIASRWHVAALIVIRALMGVGGGCSFPATHVLLAHWAPPAERSFMSSLIYAGTALGTMIFMYVSGILLATLGWEWTFYIEGLVCTIWMILWVIFISDSPKTQTLLITDDEREYIIQSLQVERVGNQETKKLKLPLRKILSSVPFWAIFIAHICNGWGFYMVLIELPLFFKHVLKFNTSENGLYTAVPYLTMWIYSMILSRALDFLRAKKTITTTTARRISTLIATVIPSVCFVALNFIGCDRTWAVALMTISITSSAGIYSGFLSNHIDIAPNFAGTLVAMTNTFATIPGILVSIITGLLIQKDPSVNSWKIVFGITIGLYIVEIIVYTLCSSGEVQKWNEPDEVPMECEPLKRK